VTGADTGGIGMSTVISGCYNSGTITGANWAGGITSYLYANGSVTNSYNTGTVNAPSAGGIVGRLLNHGGSIQNSYSSGAIIGGITGGMFGEDTFNSSTYIIPIISNSYYLEGSAPQSHKGSTANGAAIAKSDAELKALALTLGNAYEESEDGGYPILVWQLDDDHIDAVKTADNGVATATIKGGDLSARADNEGSVAVTFDIKMGDSITETVVNLTNRSLEALKNANASLTLQTDLGTYAFNSIAIQEIVTAADADALVLNIKKTAAHTYEITLKKGTTTIFTEEKNGTVSVTLPYERVDSAKNVKVFLVVGENKTDMNASYIAGSKTVVFGAKHFSVYSIEEVEKPTSGGTDGGSEGNPTAAVWDGVTIDVSWYTPGATSYHISKPAQLAGLAAIVNGIYNEDSIVVGDDGQTKKIVDNKATSSDASGPQGNNMSTAAFHYGDDNFAGKTVYLDADLDMGGSGTNYMPVGGQYLMAKNDYDTKISASFNGTFDGGNHWIRNIHADRNCDTGNYGDGASVGLIGRLGVHDGDPTSLYATNPTVKNVAVTGYIYGNRHVGGIVGKIGKTNGGGVVENCANFATIVGTDAKGTGGIVGASWNGGIVKNCFNAGNVNGGWPAGGIVGANENTIENCYNRGTVTSNAGSSFAMGIGTDNGGAPTVTNSYYLAGSAEGGGYYANATDKGTPNDPARTSEFMKLPDFLNTLGSAFAEDTGNINQGYPVLAWMSSGKTGTGTPGGGDSDKTEDTDEPNVAGTSEVKTDPAKVEVKDDSVTATTKVETTEVKTAVEEAQKAVDEAKKADPNANVVGEVKIVIKQEEPKDGETAPKITEAVAEIPAEAIREIADAKDLILTVESELATVTLDSATLTELVKGVADTETIRIDVSVADNKTALTEEQQALVGENPVIEADVYIGNTKVHDFGGTVTVSVPYTPPATVKAEDYDLLTVYFLNDKGELTEIFGAKYDPKTGLLTFKTNHFSTFVLREWINPFTDVTKEAWYYKAVRYGYSNELLTGTSADKFSPDLSLTRAQLVTLLYRNAGSPTVAGGAAFSDVKNGEWYSDAVAWASATGIVSGYGDGLFGTNDVITREQFATILYRLSGSPAVGGGVPDAQFSDADKVSSWATDAIAWATATGLITGRTATTVVPEGTASRAEAVTLLQRYIEGAK
jgi:hypothetical protein